MIHKLDFQQKRTQLFDRLKNGWSSRDEHQSFIWDLFEYQYTYNEVYQQFCQNIGQSPSQISQVSEIPYLPISAFKHHKVITGNIDFTTIFTSSGTSGQSPSQHYVTDMDFYLEHTTKIWQLYFSNVSEYCFLALLPGYLEREGSSLIAMMQHFITQSQHSESGFYLYNHEELYQKLERCKSRKIPTVLWGVTYSLLDFREKYLLDFPELIVVETGGMKGQREEISKEYFHKLLKEKWNIARVVSEYGMTELMSQAYSTGEISFMSNDCLIVHTAQINDPLCREKNNKPGIICLTDLANIDSCSFMQTEDLGIVKEDGSFKVLGRLEASEWRGCNLLVVG